MSKYADIIARLEKAEGPDRGIDGAIAMVLGLMPNGDRYTASIDAAIALVERMLPGWCNSSIRTGDNEFAAYIWKGGFPRHKEYSCEGSPSRCAVILLALFRALDAQEDRT